MNDLQFRRRARHLLIAWAALIMGLAQGTTTLRIVAATAHGTWLMMLGLGSGHAGTRARALAAKQPAHQFEPGHLRGAR